MKKSLTINATRDGKKVSKSLGFINPDAANSIVGGFAQMVNALTNDTFVNAEVVKKMDTTEEEQQGGGSGGSTDYDSTFRVFNIDDALSFDTTYDCYNITVQRGTTKSLILTGDGSFELIDDTTFGYSGLEYTGATLNGRILSITPIDTSIAGSYYFQIKYTNSQGSSLYDVAVHVIVPVTPN